MHRSVSVGKPYRSYIHELEGYAHLRYRKSTRLNWTLVKQAIAVQRILPFWKFFSKDIDTPKGALALHWVSSVILILACPTTADGYGFAVGLFTYGHIIIGSE